MTSGSGLDPVRPLAYAGSWYTSDPARLGREVDAWLDSVPPLDGRPLGLLAPHAGLRYSGHVAAWSYAALRQAGDELTVVLVGPSHYAYVHGCAVLRRGGLETPWGVLPIDAELAEEIAETLSAAEHRAVHAREHALELHLPLLARVRPGARVVPIIMGDQSSASITELAGALAASVRGRSAVLAASSDLSHYERRERARMLDGRVLACLDAVDPDALMRLLEREPGHACGGGPMAAVLLAARELGATAGGVRQYADSGDVSGDTTRVVGYASAVWTAA
ncbi:MAG TPA: AmmeMemoRadiSam system protein B [Vicinamibacterales bacterium]